MNTDPATTVATIKAFEPDASAWQSRVGGYVGWKFSELARYKGYAFARDYAERMRHWVDFERKHQGCLLNTTFSAFLEAEKQTLDT